MDFYSLDESIQSPQLPVTPEEVAFADEDLSDESALAIVLADTVTAETYLQSKSIISGLDIADDLFRGYVKPRLWPNGKARSNLSSFLVLECVEKILPSLHLTLWGSKKNPFELQPLGKTTPEAARAKSKILSWAIKQAGLKEETRRSLKSILQYGFMVGNWGWESRTQTVKKFVRNEQGQIERQIEHRDINQPFFRALDLRRVLIDPACDRQDVRDASCKYIILQMSITADDLDSLRDDPGYRNVPSREELATILASRGAQTQDSLRASKTNVWRDLQAESDFQSTSADPMNQPLELLEYWSDDRVITILNRTIVIRNESNEFGRKTQVSCAFIDVLGSAWGFGIAKLLSGEQRFVTGTRNTWVDSLALSLNPMFQLLKGTGNGTQQITVSPGRVITESGELKPLVTPSVTGEAINAISNSEERANRLVGANGGSSMPTQALRTAEGINAFAGDVIQRLQYFLEIYIELVFVPVLEAFLEMCTDRLTEAQINDILAAEDGKAYDGDILDVYNAECQVQVNAGAKLTSRVAASQLAPMLIQLLSNQAVQGSLVIQNKKFDYAELLDEALPLMGWDVDSLIVNMTPEDQQRAQQQNPAMIKGQQDQVLQNQKHANDLENIDAKGMAQAGVAIIRQTAKAHLEDASGVLKSLQATPVEGLNDAQ